MARLTKLGTEEVSTPPDVAANGFTVFSDPFNADEVDGITPDHTSEMAILRAALNEPLDKTLVKKRRGMGKEKDGSPKMLDYLEWHTVVRQLNGLFGPDKWETDIVETKTFGIDPNGTGIPMAVTVTMRLTVCWPEYTRSTFTNVGVGVCPGRNVWSGDQITGVTYSWGDFDMAYKGAAHDALKRCATALGDQFGLSLYDKEETPVAAEAVQTATAKAPTKAAPTRQTATEYDYEADETAYCETCEKPIHGYVHSKTGKIYRTADLVDISRRTAGGRVLCYDCRMKARSS